MFMFMFMFMCFAGEPIVKHGYTLTSEVSVLEVLTAIHASAFAVSRYPVVLSLEMHLSLPQQARLVAYLHLVFGETLRLPLHAGAEALPSPEALCGQIIVKAKVVPDVQLFGLAVASRHEGIVRLTAAGLGCANETLAWYSLWTVGETATKEGEVLTAGLTFALPNDTSSGADREAPAVGSVLFDPRSTECELLSSVGGDALCLGLTGGLLLPGCMLQVAAGDARNSVSSMLASKRTSGEGFGCEGSGGLGRQQLLILRFESESALAAWQATWHGLARGRRASVHSPGSPLARPCMGAAAQAADGGGGGGGSGGGAGAPPLVKSPKGTLLKPSSAACGTSLLTTSSAPLAVLRKLGSSGFDLDKDMSPKDARAANASPLVGRASNAVAIALAPCCYARTSSRRRSSGLSFIGSVREESAEEVHTPRWKSIEVERRNRLAEEHGGRPQEESQHSHRSDEDDDTADTDNGKQPSSRTAELPPGPTTNDMYQLRAVWTASPWHQVREDLATRQQRALRGVTGLANLGQLARQQSRASRSNSLTDLSLSRRSTALRAGGGAASREDVRGGRLPKGPGHGCAHASIIGRASSAEHHRQKVNSDGALLGQEQQLAWVALNWLALSPVPGDGISDDVGLEVLEGGCMPAEHSACASDDNNRQRSRSAPAICCPPASCRPDEFLQAAPAMRQRSGTFMMRRFSSGNSSAAGTVAGTSDGGAALPHALEAALTSPGESTLRGSSARISSSVASLASLRRFSTISTSGASTTIELSSPSPAVLARMAAYPKLPQVSFLSGVKHRGFGSFYLPFEISSYAEPKLDKAIREEGAAVWRLHHQSQMGRVYPGGMRVTSSNYNPFPFWEAGMQMVALNFQTNEMQLRANRGLFAQNGGCGYLLKPPAQKAGTKHWLKLEVISAHHVPKVGEGRVQHDAVPWHEHAPALNTKSAAPNARAPDDLYLVATLLGGGADACLLGARPAAASKDEAAVDEAAALGQGQRRLQSKAVSSNGLQAVFKQPFYVRTSSPQLAVLHVAVHAAAHTVRGGVTGDAIGPTVAYAALPLGALRFGCRVFQLCAPDCGRTSMPNASSLVVPQLAVLCGLLPRVAPQALGCAAHSGPHRDRTSSCTAQGPQLEAASGGGWPSEGGPKPPWLHHPGGPIAFSALLCRAERCAEQSPPPSHRAAATADRLPDRLLDPVAARMRPAQHTASCKGAAAGRGVVAAGGDCKPEARAPATAAGDSSAGESPPHDFTRTTSNSNGNYEIMRLEPATQSDELVPPASVRRGRVSAISSASQHSSNRGGEHTPPRPAPLSPRPYAEALSDNQAMCSSHSIWIGCDGRTASNMFGGDH